MKIKITGKHMSVGDALTRHIESRLTDAVEKYFKNPVECAVVLSKKSTKKAHFVHTEIVLHPRRGLEITGEEELSDAYASFDAALDKVRRQMLRAKEKSKDHHRQMEEMEERVDALIEETYSLSGETRPSKKSRRTASKADSAAEGAPLVIAEMTKPIEILDVSEAVKRLDQSPGNIVVFKNRGHGGLNVVYKRGDGHISWVDPEGFEKAARRV